MREGALVVFDGDPYVTYVYGLRAMKIAQPSSSRWKLR
jgi:hypothetical protein